MFLLQIESRADSSFFLFQNLGNVAALLPGPSQCGVTNLPSPGLGFPCMWYVTSPCLLSGITLCLWFSEVWFRCFSAQILWWVTLFGVLSASWTYKFMLLTKWGGFLAILSLNPFLSPIFLLLFFRDCSDMSLRTLGIVPRSLKIYIVFSSHSPLCGSVGLPSSAIDLSWSSLLPSSVISNLLLSLSSEVTF